MKFTINQKLAAISRELTMRRRVYPGQVERNAISQERADHEIAVMEAIWADYQAQKPQQPGLFDMEGGAR